MTDKIYVAYMEVVDGSFQKNIFKFDFERAEHHDKIYSEIVENNNILGPVTVPNFLNRVSFFSNSEETLNAFIFGLGMDKNWLLSVAINPTEYDNREIISD